MHRIAVIAVIGRRAFVASRRSRAGQTRTKRIRNDAHCAIQRDCVLHIVFVKIRESEPCA